jgi:hypothetical protein
LVVEHVLDNDWFNFGYAHAHGLSFAVCALLLIIGVRRHIRLNYSEI